MPYDDDNQGALFKNDKRPEGSKQPEYRGPCTINGVEMEVAAWIREMGPNSKTPGKKFFSLQFQKPWSPEGEAKTAPAREPAAAIPDDEIPF